MSWQSRSDLGLQMIAQVHDSLKIPEFWRVDEPRGFTWWASDYAQRIWCDPGLFHHTQSVYRVHAEIELMRGKGHASEAELTLCTMMASASLSAIVYEPQHDLFKLQCSVYATDENVDWLGKLFMAAVGLQVADATHRGEQLARTLKAAPAVSAHPDHGMRSEADIMTQAVERFFRPFGAQPSKWDGSSEWNECNEILKRLAEKRSTDGSSYFYAEFPWPDEDLSIVLEATTQRPHPELGNGLRIALRLPILIPADQAAHRALELNGLERKEWKWCQDLGSWCSEGETVSFVCF
ncbi:MAG TPA: hypothetical protein VM328_02140, partial [Fimbriimonadaceae bacterium]|nr:hypothetical protein [Fimbriimonadaceae bacterium]